MYVIYFSKFMMNSIINENDLSIINTFDMIVDKLNKIELTGNKIVNFLQYQERRKTRICGMIFDWDFDIEYKGNNEDFPKSDSIIIELSNCFNNIKDFSENLRNGEYDFIIQKNNVNEQEINDDRLINYEIKNQYVSDIIEMHLHNNFLKDYDITIKSY